MTYDHAHAEDKMCIGKLAGRAAGVALVFLALEACADAQGAIEERVQIGVSVGSGARAFGMGGAFIAVADDATASSWNPAGLCVLEKPETSVVLNPLSQSRTHVPAYAYEFDAPSPARTYVERTEPYAFSVSSTAFNFASVTYPFRVGSVKLVPQIDYQRAIDLGSDFEYVRRYSFSDREQMTGGIGRSGGSGGAIQRQVASGGLDILAASLGVGLTQKLYLGVAINRWTNGSSLRRSYQESKGDFAVYARAFNQLVDIKSDQTFRGTNLHLGALVRPTDKLRLGFVFKTPFSMKYESHLTSDQSFETARTEGAVSQQADEAGSIEWPQAIGFGVAVLPTDFLTFSADFTASRWSKATYGFTRNTIVNGIRSSASVSVLWPTLSDLSHSENTLNRPQADTRQVRFGTEYIVKRPNFAHLVVLPLRAGVFIDRQLFRDTVDGGAVQLLGITGGFGLVWSHFSLDLAYVNGRENYFSRDFTRPRANGTRDMVQAHGEDQLRSHRLYVSSIVRF